MAHEPLLLEYLKRRVDRVVLDEAEPARDAGDRVVVCPWSRSLPAPGSQWLVRSIETGRFARGRVRRETVLSTYS
jgi:hypothetical protein